MATSNRTLSQRVNEHYERLPYPPRNPLDEGQRLLPTHLDHLDQLNTWGFAGQLDLQATFRVLIAGGGTGDATVFLAEQLRHTSAELIHLDLSQAAIDVTAARLQQRGLTNVRLLRASLLEAPALGLGFFDYINCSGVLHHLEDPDVGLAALTAMLTAHGVVGIMLYGRHGRAGVYQMQELMRRYHRTLGDHEDAIENIDDQLASCRRMLAGLPATNWFRRQADDIHDHKSGDAGLYDLLLHSQDRAYTVPEVYEFLAKQDLELLTFVQPNGGGRADYLAQNYIFDPVLLRRIHHLPLPEQQAITELIAGNLMRHAFYATRRSTTRPVRQAMQLDDIPSWSLHFNVDGRKAWRVIDQLAKARGHEVVIEHAQRKIVAAAGPSALALLRAVDGQRSVREIVAQARSELALEFSQVPGDHSDLLAEFGAIVESFALYDWLLLRKNRHWPLRTLQQMQSDVSTSSRG